MADITGNIVTQTQRRSFLFQCASLILGSILILLGSFVLRDSPYLGASLWVCGLTIDMYTIYIVYREMVDVRTDIETARSEIQRTKTDIQNTKEEIVEIQMKVEDTAQRIEGIATDMYDRQGSTDMWDELKTTPANRKKNISRDKDDPYEY